MEAPQPQPKPSLLKSISWTGWVFTILPVLFLLLDTTMKLMKLKVVTDTMGPLGYADDLARPIGIILLLCVILYVIPWTAVLGAVLLTGYLGGAVATNFRVGNPLYTHILFPIYVAIFLWIGLLLRDRRLRALFPFRWRIRPT
jgi:hypothetical protein